MFSFCEDEENLALRKMVLSNTSRENVSKSIIRHNNMSQIQILNKKKSVKFHK